MNEHVCEHCNLVCKLHQQACVQVLILSAAQGNREGVPHSFAALVWLVSTFRGAHFLVFVSGNDSMHSVSDKVL